MKRLVTHGAMRIRRGVSTAEFALIVALIGIAVAIGAAFLGGPTATRTQDTADGVGNPAELKQFFDDMDSGGS